MINFSARTQWDRSEHPFAVALAAARRRGALLDLTAANPTTVGLLYADDAFTATAHDELSTYEPLAAGSLSAREAVAAYYADAGAIVQASEICLTTSTSDAYSYLFRLLCDAGDEVLLLKPGYPLLDFLADLDDVVLREVPMYYAERWFIDLAELERAITPRTRALVVVHPNNPTGSAFTADEQDALLAMCARRGIALIADEVFLDFMLEQPARSFAACESEALLFVLSGLSKVCGLPQMKCSWIAAKGPQPLQAEALARLEVIADTFLAVSTPAQAGMARWLAGRRVFQQEVIARMQCNAALLRERAAAFHGELLSLDGGWTVVLRVPRHVQGVAFAEAALAHGVAVQPGSLYGLGEGRVVLSLLTPPKTMRAAMALLAAMPLDVTPLS
jgi:alanine-synthesizing transaminase